jgi:hypothetical protein
MKSHANLFPAICEFENLVSAARVAARGKKSRPDVADFLFHLERNALRLREELLTHSYRPGGYHQFQITEPKPRTISAAPFRDRVVHHALCRVVEPVFERSFIYDSYACRVGKGTHRALDRFTHFARRFPYVLKCDIRRFFPSVDRQILYERLARKLRDEDVLWLSALVLENGPDEPAEIACFAGDNLLTPLERPRGLPIGNLTSQFLANVYLDPLDHFVSEQLGVGGYLRYCDDFALFGETKAQLTEAKGAVAVFLADLRLRLHPTKCMIYPVAGGVAFLGFKVFPDHRLLLKPSIRRFRLRSRRLERDFAEGHTTAAEVSASVQAWCAHAANGDTYRLRGRLLRGLVLSKG